MAHKPRSEWTDAYRRRVERGERQGKSKQEARGHRAGSETYRERMRKRAYKLLNATPEKETLRRRGDVPRPSYAEVDDLILEHGFAPVIEFALRKEQLKEHYRNAISYQDQIDYQDEFDDLESDYEEWDLDFGFFIYH
jgi:hypothetical protein